MGWFIERRLQQFLIECASTDHIDLVSLRLFDFQDVRQQLQDGVFNYYLCPYLKAELGGSPNPGAGGGTGGSSGRRVNYPTDTIVNPQARSFRLTGQDMWQVFLDHAREAPLANMCCRYHLNGRCVDSCNYRHTHVPLTAEQLAAMPGWLAKCRCRMRNPAAAGDDRGGQNKKPSK